MRYSVIDFETAGPSLASICQIGLAIFENRQLVNTRSWLINPETPFHPVNISIHRITEQHVANAPIFPAVWPEVLSEIADRPVVHHTHFDRTAALRAAELHGLAFTAERWIDSARIVRRVFPEFAQSGFGLGALAEHFAIEFKHHDAAEDARCAGEILARTLDQSGSKIDEWFARLKIDGASGDYYKALKLTGHPDGPLAGETCVFTGTLSLPRQRIAEMAAAMGANVTPGVNKHTTIVVVGDQDAYRLAGHEKSSKHRKAEEMAATGHPIRILNEADFISIAGN